MSKKKIEFTQKQLDEMVKMHNDGFLHREIAEKFNTSRSTIDRKLRELNISSRHPWLNEEREKMAIELYKKYQNETKVAKEVHMSASTVRDILVRNNVYMPSMSEIKRIYDIDETYFDIIDTHEKAYFLGLLYADGCVDEKHNKVYLSLQEEDKHILLQFKEALKTQQPLYFREFRNHVDWKNQYCLCISNKRICEALVSHGCFQRKSLKLKFPEDMDKEYYSSFILGYFDGDGWISKNTKDKRCSITGTLDFCTKVSTILKEELDINTSISYDHHKTEKPTRTIKIAGGNQVKKLMEWLYSKCDIYLERKRKRYVDVYC